MECRSVYISPPIVFHGSRKVHSSELEIKFGKSPGAIKKLCGVVNRFEFGERENLVTCGVKVVRQLLDRDQIASESISGIIAAADATAPTFLPPPSLVHTRLNPYKFSSLPWRRCSIYKTSA